MSKNDSQVVIHHFIDSLSNVKFLTMACFIIIAIVIVLILLIILAIVIFMVLKKYKHEPQRSIDPHNGSKASQLGNSYVSKNHSRDNFSHPSGIHLTDNFENDAGNINSSAQHIPMTVLKSRRGEQREDSSESSAGLCELLLTTPHDGDVIYESPPELLAFAGRVFASTRRKPRVPNTEPGISRSDTEPPLPRRQPLNPESHSSLEWDYFEPRHYSASNASNISETVDVCWV